MVPVEGMGPSAETHRKENTMGIKESMIRGMALYGTNNSCYMSKAMAETVLQIANETKR